MQPQLQLIFFMFTYYIEVYYTNAEIDNKICLGWHELELT